MSLGKGDREEEIKADLLSRIHEVPDDVSSANLSQFSISSTRLPNPPTYVEWEDMRFLIMDAPSDGNLALYLKEMKRYGVTDLVRVCDPTYSNEAVENEGIKVHELVFADGDGPPEAVVDRWLALVRNRFFPSEENGPKGKESSKGTIGIHCVAGLGRAPVLVAIALIETGMSPLDAVVYLRDRRRGAINSKQLRFLESYKRKGLSASFANQKCQIM